MKNHLRMALIYCMGQCLFACRQSPSQEILTYSTSALQKPVEILVDRWGVPHIYAENEHDLFFSQGYYAAKDRLFQFEIWRRQATGTVAEILGPRELKRDIGTRLFQFRGDMEEEMKHYHPNGVEIISAYVEGVNAYIQESMKTPEDLPLEFQLLGIQPQPWTPEIVISRHQGLLGNIQQELDVGRAVAILGADKVKQLLWFHPGDPALQLDSPIYQPLLFEDILELYNAYRKPIRFQPEDLVDPRMQSAPLAELGVEPSVDFLNGEVLHDDRTAIGSNNWLISGEKTKNGHPIMANDPHRTLAAPSLRYISHLSAPGWNVIGGGEPEIPGISIGHNEVGAWGLTVFRTDAEDLYVYQLHPQDPNKYKYKGKWEKMTLIRDTIAVKGGEMQYVTHKYTRHGPVVYEDPDLQAACAVRCGWLEIGGSPYLASLRMDQATDFESFREACNYSHIPGENMIWADTTGKLGWQAVGIAPIRNNFSGMVPVPGDGRYEWEGYLEIKERPHLEDMPEGFFSTANQHVTPSDYPHTNALGFSWSDPFRGDRLKEVLSSRENWNLKASAALQTDYYAIPARILIPMIQDVELEGELEGKAYELLQTWDYVLDRDDKAAALYVGFEKALNTHISDKLIPKEARAYIPYLQLSRVIECLQDPDAFEFPGGEAGIQEVLQKSFSAAVAETEQRLGDNIDNWVYGQLDYKHVVIKHPLTLAVNDSLKKLLDVGPAPRGGYGQTVGNTSYNDNQTHGATFRVHIDVGDWDASLAANSPGQGGDPNGSHYRDLFDMWVQDQYFPLVYSRSAVERWTVRRIKLVPN
ncbi:MAG: penicillin acylase family protein [Bacteroidota bacterium]